MSPVQFLFLGEGILLLLLALDTWSWGGELDRLKERIDHLQKQIDRMRFGGR